MDERQTLQTRNSSRTLVKVAVAVLAVIAIAGVVLATFKPRPPAEGPGARDATQQASAPMTGSSALEVAAEAEAGPNQVVFAPGSAELSNAATTKLLRLAEKAKTDKQALTIVARVEPQTEGKDQRTQLARNRAIAVRGVLEANGVPLPRMETRIEGVASGLASAKGANRIEVNPR